MMEVKTILLDMDGVLWRGGQPLVDLALLFKMIQSKRMHVFCVTNNSARTVDFYQEKFAGLGVMLEHDQIISSAEGSAAFLVEKFPDKGSIFVVGEKGLIETLDNYGFLVVDQPKGDHILAVVAGLDRQLTYQKIDQAARLIDQGAVFIGTNPDQTIPVSDGIAPGAGTVIGAIEIASGQQALIIGKPNPSLFELALQRSKTSPEQTLMVGDRLSTDIKGAQNLGIRTALVLSGITDIEEAQGWDPAPDIIVEDVVGVLDLISNEES